jgi:hypothetical protein
MSVDSSQIFETYVPVYDSIPDKWEDARPFLVEQLRKISNGVNAREVGFFLDEELLSGKAFVPGITAPGNNPGLFRGVFRKLVDVSPLVAGANVFAHNITYDVNFTLLSLWVAATDSVGLTSLVITGNDVTLDATNININSPGAYDRAWCVIEYILEQ